MSVFFPRGYFPPKTAAERQRDCRANGKGRHRGGSRATKAEKDAALRRIRAEVAAIEALEAAQESPATPEQVAEIVARLRRPAESHAASVTVTIAPAAPRMATWHEGAD